MGKERLYKNCEIAKIEQKHKSTTINDIPSAYVSLPNAIVTYQF